MSSFLIVDDIKELAENLAEIVGATGAEVTVAHDGAQALNALRAKSFDAAVTDMRMPGLSGAELVHELRRADPGLPMVVISAYSADDELLRAREQGLLATMGKPVPVRRLIELLGAARRQGLVILVEDDPALADNLTEALRDEGFSTLAARSIADAERLAPVHPFAAIVDLRVPDGLDGEVMQSVERRFPGIPQLVITAYDRLTPPVAPTKVHHKPFDTARLIADLVNLWEDAT